jgi:hypothetical protein
MATKSVAQKLQIKPGTTVWASGASGSDLIEPLPRERAPHGKQPPGCRVSDLIEYAVWILNLYRPDLLPMPAEGNDSFSAPEPTSDRGSAAAADDAP